MEINTIIQICIIIIILCIFISFITYAYTSRQAYKSEVRLWRTSNTENLIKLREKDEDIFKQNLIIESQTKELNKHKEKIVDINRYIKDLKSPNTTLYALKKRVYISGKITGDVDGAHRSFAKAEHDLLEAGYKPINPMHINPYELNYLEFMQIDLLLLGTCSAIYMLSNWKDSRGAKIEREMALAMGIEVMYEEELK